MFKCNFKAYEGPEKYIFISYAHKDSDTVFPILERLNAEGYRVWFDDGIVPGSEWPEYIANHLNNCETFVFFASPNSVASDNCKREVNYALSKNKRFFTVSLVPTEFTPGLELQTATQQNIRLYDYSDTDKFYDTFFTSSSIVPCKRTSENDTESFETAAADNEYNEASIIASTNKSNKKLLLIISAIALSAIFISVLAVFMSNSIEEKQNIDQANVNSAFTISEYDNNLCFEPDTVIDKSVIRKLNKLDFDNVYSVTFDGCTIEKDADLASLSLLPAIKSITFRNVDISDYSFLKNAETLEKLQVTDCAFNCDAANLPTKELREAVFENSGEIDLNILSDCENLSILTVKDCSLVPVSETLPCSIVSLTLSGCGITDTDFLADFDFTNILEIDLSNNDISDVSFLSKYYESLRKLDISDTNPTIASLSVVSICYLLEDLNMSGVKIDDLSVIAEMDNLTTLNMSRCGLTSLNNGNLENKCLRTLILSHNSLGSIEELATMKLDGNTGINLLDISDNKILTLKGLPATHYYLLSVYGNNFMYSSDSQAVKALSSNRIAVLLSDSFPGLEEANVTSYMVLIDEDEDAANNLTDNGFPVSILLLSSDEVEKRLIRSNYDLSLW